MAREHLSGRGNWQRLSSARGQSAEDIFYAIMSMHCRDSGIETAHKPKDLKSIYGTRYPSGAPHGIEPEFSFYNPKTNKKFYVEMKRQGAGGNAHERACKYLAPGILTSIREIASQPENVIPVWFIFSNGIARDQNRQQEIRHWFRGYDGNLLLWENLRDIDTLVNHFETHIRPLL